jgi:sarcosine oxidase, subunit delta
VSFLLTCPHCGEREVTDFAFGGELLVRPQAEASFRELCRYNYFRRNVAGIQREWWFHRSGCHTWFLADRDTRTNQVLRVGLPDELGP